MLKEIFITSIYILGILACIALMYSVVSGTVKTIGQDIRLRKLRKANENKELQKK